MADKTENELPILEEDANDVTKPETANEVVELQAASEEDQDEFVDSLNAEDIGNNDSLELDEEKKLKDGNGTKGSKVQNEIEMVEGLLDKETTSSDTTTNSQNDPNCDEDTVRTSEEGEQKSTMTQLSNHHHKPQAEDKTSTSRIILKLLRSEQVYMTAGIAALVVSSSTNLAFPRILGAVVDTVSVPKSSISRQNGLGKLLLKAMFSFSVGSVASFTRVYSFAMAKMGIASTLRRALFAEIIQSHPNADAQSSIAEPGCSHEDAVASQAASLSNTLGQDVDVLSGAICKTLASTLRSCSSIFGGTCMLLSLSPRLTMVSIGILPMVGATAMLAGKQVKRLSASARATYDHVASFALARMSYIKTVRLYCQEDTEQKHFEALLARTTPCQQQVALAEGLFMAGLSVAINVSLVMVLAAGSKLVAKGALTGGQLTSFGMYSGMVALGSSGLSSVYADAVKVRGACERLVDILKQSREFKEGEEVVADAGSQVAEVNQVVFENVNFQYPNRDTCVVENFSLTLPAGKVVALTGHSGAGKSTLIGLLTRFNSPSEGRVLFDGDDIMNMPLQKVRRSVAVVSQQPGIFEDSVFSNIAYGLPTASLEQVKLAAQEADADQFIEELPEKYETIISKETLSVGQRQRIAIARALLVDAPVVVLDEGTASLSGSSEGVVAQTMDKLKQQGKIVFVVAHRRTTLDTADLVCVMDDGKAVEVGTPEELAAQSDSLFNRITKAAVAGIDG